MALLELEHVAKAFGPKILFRRVNAALMPGTVSLLGGANGAGKSTLMRIMADLIRPDAGKVIRRVPDEKLGYMAHATFLYKGLSAEENLLFWAHASKIRHAEERVKKALSRVGLARHAHERAGIFSRGMAQRLNLARLLLAEPMLLLLDEPATGLDAASRAVLIEIMLEAKAKGAAILWISHNIEEDSAYADTVFMLQELSLTQKKGGAPC